MMVDPASDDDGGDGDVHPSHACPSPPMSPMEWLGEAEAPEPTAAAARTAWAA